MLDGRQRSSDLARRRDGTAVQSLPAYEADYAAQDSRQPPLLARGGDHRSLDCGKSTAFGRTDGQSEELTRAVPPRSRGRRKEAAMPDHDCNLTRKSDDAVIVGG